MKKALIILVLTVLFIAMQYYNAILWTNSSLSEEVKGMLGYLCGLVIVFATGRLTYLTFNK